MNLSLLQMIGKYLTVFVVSTMSYFNIGTYTENNKELNNILLDKDGEIVNAISYETVVKKEENIPNNITNVIQKGEVGISYNEVKQNKETKQEETKTVVVEEAKQEIIEQGTGAYGIFQGDLVGYGPDCTGCSGEGYLSCKTESGDRFSLKYDGIYYKDSKFGDVRILAANKSKFPCGTIIQIEKKDGTKFLAVVLDTISTKLDNGKELMDLAYASQTDKTVFAADGLVGKNVTFNVQRWGW